MGGSDSDSGGEELPTAESINESKEFKALLEEVKSLRAEIQGDKKAAAVRSLLESMDREATDLRITALAGVPEASRKALVESWPKRQPPNTKPQRTTPLVEADAGDKRFEKVVDHKSFAAAILV